MPQISKITYVIVKPAHGLNRFLTPCAVNLVPIASSRHFSSEANALTDAPPSFLRRGRGGRSSFNGQVATVYGATGYTGPVVCNRLGKIGTQLIIPYRSDPYFVRDLKLVGDLGQVLFQQFKTIEDEEAIRNAVKYSSVVVNLLGCEYETRNFTFKKANVEATARIARISKEMGVKKFIHVSALNCQNIPHGLYKNSGSKFLHSKAQSEIEVKKHFPDAVIVRPSNIWGNDDKFIRTYIHFARTCLPFVGLPNSGIDIWKQPLYVGDFAECITRIATDPDISARTFELLGTRRYELRSLVEWFYASVNRERSIVDAKYDLTTRLRGYLNENFHVGTPYAYLTLDRLEREALTDVTTGCPTLADLGVESTPLEERIEYELWLQFYGRKDQRLGWHEKPTPPNFIEASRIV